MCKSAFPEVEGEAFRGVQWTDLDKIYPSVDLEALEIRRKHTGYPKFLFSLCPRRRFGGAVISACMRKSAFSEVEGEAFRGVEWIDLDKIYPSVGLEALEMHRKHTGYPKFPNSLCARRVPLRYYSRGYAQKCFHTRRRRSFSRGGMDRSRLDLPICGPRSEANSARFLFRGSATLGPATGMRP